MAIMERDFVMQGVDENGNMTMDFPITRLANIEDSSDEKISGESGDYIPIIDSADKGQMKKITVGNLLAASSSIPVAFSIEAAAWAALTVAVAGCGYSAEIAAEGVTAADYPDIYFDENSLEAAAGIVAGTAAGKVVLYAKTAPETALSGAYFIRKGSAV